MTEQAYVNDDQDQATASGSGVFGWIRHNLIMVALLVLVVIALIVQHSDETAAKAQAKKAERVAACQSWVNAQMSAALKARDGVFAQSQKATGQFYTGLIRDMGNSANLNADLAAYGAANQKLGKQAAKEAPLPTRVCG